MRRLVSKLLLLGGLLALPWLAHADLTVAISRSPLSLPLFVAQDQDLFHKNGLTVTAVECLGGVKCLDLALEGKADVITCAEIPVVMNAQPLRFMDYLIEDAFHAAVLLDKGAVLVNLPDPGRFALHELIVHERRHTSNIQKKKKDLAQAAAMIGFLAKNHTSLIEDAWTDLLRKHRTWGEIVSRSAANLPEEAKNLPVVASILHTDFSRKRYR